MTSEPPAVPTFSPPDASWEHRALYDNVIKALYALPSYFQTDLRISGVLATDLFTFNSSLGATIEAQVVEALNAIRGSWDPEQKYAAYSFVRQAQRFPDVILRTAAAGTEPAILMGIELKGWYVLAKEREPSFRYRASPQVCAPADLLVVYPWALSSVISGSPQLYPPFVTGARYAAEYRNYWWQHVKEGGARNALRLSTVDHYYPAKSEPISDVAVHDDGGNFGRFARTGIMDEYRERLFREELSGIPLSAWQKFLSAFSEDKTEAQINRAIDQAIAEAAKTAKPVSEGAEAAKNLLSRVLALLE
ncbi:MAG: hypothetical protein JO250_10625 [Armatimonadetes bacterium]|nr:hypothetical protein [Armatimonadota bacterium]